MLRQVNDLALSRFLRLAELQKIFHLLQTLLKCAQTFAPTDCFQTPQGPLTMLDTVTVDHPVLTDSVGAPDWIPRTLLEAQEAWEELRRRNMEIRKRFQDAHRKDVLLRSTAMLEAWQS